MRFRLTILDETQREPMSTSPDGRFELIRESGIAPGGDPAPSDVLDWGKWRKKVLAGEKLPPPQAPVLNSQQRWHATPGSEERRWL